MGILQKLKSEAPDKGQMTGAMGIVTLVVAVMIGAVVVGEVFDSVDTDTLPSSANDTIHETLDAGTTGLSLLGIAAIVGAAMFIISILGGAVR